MLDNFTSNTSTSNCEINITLEEEKKHKIPLFIIYTEKSRTYPSSKIDEPYSTQSASTFSKIDLAKHVQNYWNLCAFSEEKTNQKDLEPIIEKEAQKCLNQIYSFGDSVAEALDCMFEFVESSLSEHDLLSVDALLKNIDLEQTKQIVFIGLLRGTFRARSKLNSWNLCAAKVSKLLDTRGKDKKRLLRGLISSDDTFTLSTTITS